MYGPRHVEVPEMYEMVLPSNTVLNNVFPNPMRTGGVATFGIDVKDDKTASLKIFNIIAFILDIGILSLRGTKQSRKKFVLMPNKNATKRN